MDAQWQEHPAIPRPASPSLHFDVDAYREWLVEICGAELAKRLPTLDAAETLLCWCTARGDAEAHRLFDLHYMHQVGPALQRFHPDASFVDEVTQRVRV